MDRTGIALLLATGIAIYTVRMSQFTATEARRLFFRLLDAVQRGEMVTIERGGVRFRIVAEPVPATAAVEGSPFQRIDPAVLAGDWTWCADENGQLQFRVAETGGESANGEPAQ